MAENIFNINDFNHIFGALFNDTSLKNFQYAEELDDLYWTDKTYYIYRLEKIKEKYRVLRNSKGIHKVIRR